MKNWIKDNLVLVIGLALPMLLIVLFFVATVIPKAMGTRPQYEVLFSLQDYNNQNKPDYLIDFKVKNNQLVVKAKKSDEKESYYNAKKLMAYDAKTEVMREITIDDNQLSDGAEIVLAETKNMTLDSNITAPDGYIMESSRYSNNGLVGSIFGAGTSNSSYRIKKGGVGYKISTMQNNYSYAQLQFIGWVIKK